MATTLPRVLGILGAGTHLSYSVMEPCTLLAVRSTAPQQMTKAAAHAVPSNVVHTTGQMGGGIAQLAAMKGLEVILCDMHKAALERSIATTNRSLTRLVGKQQLTQDQADSASSRIRRDSDMQVQDHQAFAHYLPPFSLGASSHTFCSLAFSLRSSVKGL